MERTFFPSRSYWLLVGVSLIFLWVGLIGEIVAFSLIDDDSLHPPRTASRFVLVSVWRCLAATVVYLPAAAVFVVRAYRRKRLVIRADEVCSHGVLLLRAMRFADVVEARWLIHHGGRSYHLHLRGAAKELAIFFDQFAERGGQDELLDLLHGRLGPNVRQNWETFQAVREGRASPWSPPELAVKKWPRLLAVTTGAALVIGAALGLLVRINIPDAVEWTWSGWPLLDWSLGSGLLGLGVGLLVLSSFRGLEWVVLKWMTVQGRRLERAISQAASGPFQTPPDSRGG